MTDRSGAVLPPWLTDAVVGLIASAYEAGRTAATAAPATPSEPQMYLTLDEAARQLRIGMTKLNELVTTGQLTSFNVGRRRFVYLRDIEAFRANATAPRERAATARTPG